MKVGQEIAKKTQTINKKVGDLQEKIQKNVGPVLSQLESLRKNKNQREELKANAQTFLRKKIKTTMHSTLEGAVAVLSKVESASKVLEHKVNQSLSVAIEKAQAKAQEVSANLKQELDKKEKINSSAREVRRVDSRSKGAKSTAGRDEERDKIETKVSTKNKLNHESTESDTQPKRARKTLLETPSLVSASTPSLTPKPQRRSSKMNISANTAHNTTPNTTKARRQKHSVDAKNSAKSAGEGTTNRQSTNAKLPKSSAGKTSHKARPANTQNAPRARERTKGDKTSSPQSMSNAVASAQSRPSRSE